VHLLVVIVLVVVVTATADEIKEHLKCLEIVNFMCLLSFLCSVSVKNEPVTADQPDVMCVYNKIYSSSFCVTRFYVENTLCCNF